MRWEEATDSPWVKNSSVIGPTMNQTYKISKLHDRELVQLYGSWARVTILACGDGFSCDLGVLESEAVSFCAALDPRRIPCSFKSLSEVTPHWTDNNTFLSLSSDSSFLACVLDTSMPPFPPPPSRLASVLDQAPDSARTAVPVLAGLAMFLVIINSVSLPPSLPAGDSFLCLCLRQCNFSTSLPSLFHSFHRTRTWRAFFAVMYWWCGVYLC